MRILIACGGTAGHIFPGLALAREYSRSEKEYQILMVVSNRFGEEERIKALPAVNRMKIEVVESSPLPYKLSIMYIPFVLKLFSALLKSLGIMLRYRPQVAVGFGGYASFAPLMAAYLTGTATLIHEQNLIPGRTNRLLARIADKIAVSFADTHNFLSAGNASGKTVKTGFPLRENILLAAKKMNNFTEKFTILVIGGSQGSRNLNELLINCWRLMSKAQLLNLQIIHLAGRKDFSEVQKKYRSLSVTARIFDFLEDMGEAYQSADLVVSRSGAGTIFEIASFGLPCILVPHCFGNRHQQENALFLKRCAAALVFDEEIQTARDLKTMVWELINDQEKRTGLSRRIKQFSLPQASLNLKIQVDLLCKES